MALIRWDPFAELNSLQQQVSSMFNDVFGNAGVGAALMPATDVYSDDAGLTIEAQLPRFKEDEITVQQHEGQLEIKAEHQEKEEDKKQDRRYLVRESVSRYYRRFALPRNADADNIAAKFENGILKVTVPYKELPQPKRIQIGAKSTKKA